MEAVGRWVLSLVCGSVLCATVRSMGPKSNLFSVICSVFLGFLVISPLKEVDFRVFLPDIREYSQAAETAAMIGVNQAEAAILDIINRQCATYILDEAAELGLEVEAQLEVDAETLLPVSATVTGSATQAQRQALQEQITQNLGIEKEECHWRNP